MKTKKQNKTKQNKTKQYLDDVGGEVFEALGTVVAPTVAPARLQGIFSMNDNEKEKFSVDQVRLSLSLSLSLSLFSLFMD